MADSSDGASTSPKPPGVGPLDTSVRVRRELRKIYLEARAGSLATADATRLAYILQAIAKLLESADLVALEARMAAMERLKR